MISSLAQALCCSCCSFDEEKKKKMKEKKEKNNSKTYEAYISSCKKESKFSWVVSCMAIVELQFGVSCDVFPEWISDECKDLIRKILTFSVKDRITIEGIRKHPWMSLEIGKDSREAEMKALLPAPSRAPRTPFLLQ